MKEPPQIPGRLVNENCDGDEDIAAQVEIAMTETRGENNREDLEQRIALETTKLKRDRFLHTARIELGMLRGIDQQRIATEAKLVFPEDLAL